MLCARQIDFLLCQGTWFAASLLWLSGAPASHTGIRQIPPLACGPSQTDCWQDSGWPHGNHEPPLDIPCARLPRGALLSTEKHSPEQKQDQTHARVGGAEPSTLGGEGVLESCRAGSRVCGGAGGAGLSETWPRPLAQGSPEFLPQVCKK